MKKIPDFYDDYPRDVLKKLKEIRKIILEVASKDKHIGPLEEVLRWGQPTFLTSETKSGSMIRIDRYKRQNDKVALFFHCQTKLVKIFRLKFGNNLNFDGNRAIILDIKGTFPVQEIKECIGLALRYNLIKDDFDDI